MGTMVHGNGLLPNILERAEYDSRIYSAFLEEPDRQDLWDKYEDILRDKANEDRLLNADTFYYEHKEEMDVGTHTLWEQRFSYRDLIKKKVEIGSRAFSSEYL